MELLMRPTGTPLFYSDYESNLDHGYKLEWLKKEYNLTDFDIELIFIALAPELDLRYERLYAYLQDDVTRKRPTVDLALHLLCESPIEKFDRRAHFSSDSSLLKHGILKLVCDSQVLFPPLLAQSFQIDEQIVRFLLDQTGLDSRLAPFCDFIYPTQEIPPSSLSVEKWKQTSALVNMAKLEGNNLFLYLRGRNGIGKTETTRQLINHVAVSALVCDLALLLQYHPTIKSFAEHLAIVFRDATILHFLIVLKNISKLSNENDARLQQVFDHLRRHSGIVILQSEEPLSPDCHPPLGFVEVTFPLPNYEQRREAWTQALSSHQIELPLIDQEQLANRYQLTSKQIEEAVSSVSPYCVVDHDDSEEDHTVSQSILERLYISARAQTGYELAKLTQKITPCYRWCDIELAEDATNQLHELCQRVIHRHTVFEEWGFDKNTPRGLGVSALFNGPPGVGKTMAAEVVCCELGVDLYKIDLSRVVSKWVGETEKNLDAIFQAAEFSHVCLFFDECDSLFGKRSNVNQAQDRFANQEISYLLQRIEEFEGLAILATNFKEQMDQAFMRRLTFSIHFSKPNAEQRLEIWKNCLPAAPRMANDLDVHYFAEKFKLSGSNIKNIVLTASIFAVENNSLLTKETIERALKREYQKIGAVLPNP
jgi:hypothetical protein